jgi:glycosyltransferase involved in cell wall biosynthesis
VKKNPTFPRSPEIAFYLPNLEGGGAERAIVTVANQLAAGGIRIELVVGNAVGPYLAEITPAVSFVEIGASSKLGSIVGLLKYLRSRKPPCIMSALDLPNLQLIAAAKLARYRGRLLISQRATIGPAYDDISPLHRQAYLTAIRFAYPLADMIISNSRAAATELHEKFGLAKDRIITIQNQIDAKQVTRLSREPLDDSWMAGGGAATIISVGSLTQRKDMGTLIRALAVVRQTRDVRLVILGEGQERSPLEELTGRLGLQRAVYLPGFDANPYRWMKQSDMLVSASRAEGFPNVIVEALALGMKVIATDCPGDTADILGYGRWGRIVPVGDAAALAKAILESLDDTSPSEGRKRVADFAPEKTINAYLRALMPHRARAHAQPGGVS